MLQYSPDRDALA